MALRLFDRLLQHLIVTVKSMMHRCKTTRPTDAGAVAALCNVGVHEEPSGKRRDRVYRYAEYVNQLRAETELDD